MNRVIKFRFAYTDGTNWILKSFEMAAIMNGEPFEVLSDSPLLKRYKHSATDQFTGLKDKNGNEIYEGDIVKAAMMYHGKPGIEFPAYIIYNEHIGSFRIAYNSLGGGSQDEIYFRYQVEVVGNIYENPELIN